MTDEPEELEAAIEAADYLIGHYKSLWRGGTVRDLAEAIDAWESARRTLRARADRIERLEAALRPFVAHGRAVGAFGGDNGPYWIMTDQGHRDVPAADFLAARAALGDRGREGA